jgi:hypothetical protein
MWILPIFGLVCLFFSFLILFRLFRVAVSYVMLRRIWSIISFCFCLLLSFKIYVSFLFLKYLIALSLCFVGWHESCGIIVYVSVGLRYIPNTILLFSFVIVMSRKLTLLYCSSSIVNFIVGITLLKMLRRSWILDLCCILSECRLHIGSILTLCFVVKCQRFLCFLCIEDIFLRIWKTWGCPLRGLLSVCKFYLATENSFGWV